MRRWMHDQQRNRPMLGGHFRLVYKGSMIRPPIAGEAALAGAIDRLKAQRQGDFSMHIDVRIIVILNRPLIFVVPGTDAITDKDDRSGKFRFGRDGQRCEVIPHFPGFGGGLQARFRIDAIDSDVVKWLKVRLLSGQRLETKPIEIRGNVVGGGVDSGGSRAAAFHLIAGQVFNRSADQLRVGMLKLGRRGGMALATRNKTSEQAEEQKMSDPVHMQDCRGMALADKPTLARIEIANHWARWEDTS